MPRGSKISIEERIQKQTEIVEKAKEKYDKELSKLKELQSEEQEEKRREILNAIEESGKSMDELYEFLNS